MVNSFPILSAAFFGTIPAVIWLFFFLPEDKNPESKKIILEVFLYGMLFALIALHALFFVRPYLLAFFLVAILFSAFFEELTKYLTIRLVIFKHHELDEPIDFMIYMITAALGFAAMENILYSFTGFLTSSETFGIATQSMLWLNLIRFTGATLLHALVSAILGYFLALSFYHSKKRLVVFGFLIATLLHVLFNFIMIQVVQATQTIVLVNYFVLLIVLMVAMLMFVLLCFRKLKKIKSICQKNF